MSFGMQTYSAAGVVIVFGPNILTGVAEDKFIEVEAEADIAELRKGADGGVTRSMVLDDNVKVTVTLKGESLSNGVLSAIAKLDKLLGAGVLPFMFVDGTGFTKVTSPQAYIKKYPNMERGKNAGECKWEFQLTHANIEVGGTLPL